MYSEPVGYYSSYCTAVYSSTAVVPFFSSTRSTAVYSSTAVVPFFSSTHVSEGGRPTQGLIVVSRVRTIVRKGAWLNCSTWDKAPL